MIIKKKKLNKALGNVQEEPQNTEMAAQYSAAPETFPEYSNLAPQDSEQQTFNPEFGNEVNQTFTQENADFNQEQHLYQEDTANLDSGESSSDLQQPQPQNLETSADSAQNDDDLFNLDNIDFKQREERRKGDRRRGFRRVDDRNLISRAREEADAIRENAMREGYEAGMAQASADLEGIRDTFAAFLNAKQEVFEMIAPDILEISVDIAQKIIKKEASEDPQVLVNNIIDVLKSLSKDENRINLRVNPVQSDAVKQEVPEILNIAGLDAKVSVLADESITEGGCLVTTSNGVVDATIETQLSVICEALRGV